MKKSYAIIFFILLSIPLFSLSMEEGNSENCDSILETDDGWSILPTETQMHILSYVLNFYRSRKWSRIHFFEDWNNLRLVNKLMNDLVSDKRLWDIDYIDTMPPAEVYPFLSKVERYKYIDLLTDIFKKHHKSLTYSYPALSIASRCRYSKLCKKIFKAGSIPAYFSNHKLAEAIYLHKHEKIEGLVNSEENKCIFKSAGKIFSAHAYEGFTELMMAVDTNDIKSISLLLPTSDINAQNDKGLNALMLAIKCGDIKIIELLLSSGADINAKDKRGLTASIHAIKSRDTNIVKQLLVKGADVNQKDNGNQTPLMHVCCDDTKTAQLLINHGALIDEATGIGSFLIKSIHRRDIPMIKLLLQNNANLDVTNSAGKTALDVAQERGYDEIANLLKEAEARSNEKDAENEITILNNSQQDEPATKELLEKHLKQNNSGSCILI